MTSLIKRRVNRFGQNLWINLVKVILLALAIIDQFKGVFQFPPPYDHHLSVLSKYIIFFFFIEFLQRVIVFFYKINRGIRKQDNIVVGINQIATIVKVFGLGFWMMMLLDINIKELFTSLSIIAAAIAIISKDYVANAISGMVLTWSDQLSINDYIKIEDQKGKIIDITLINLHLLSDDDDLIYIPNNLAFSAKIINYTKIAVKKTSIEFELNTRNLTSIEELESKLINSLTDYNKDIKPDSYNLKVYELKKNSISFKFQYILSHPDRELEKEIKKKTIRRILTILNDEKIKATVNKTTV
ncbi:MAG TPA: mechanosensitive ion channel [Saprospiraceae bacterium]|nr:mechanosensitive ion channel family protein [Saprospiraceae bacterium]HMV24163.1 mechanosensitive ion channel [Saprospiraceae bacterium]HMX86809.1 mechanosensitive ion channel [Saprospiraceae bacterium]HMZ72990.1 mechanosensitive ion channel [Saprospiraceae bacterium]HNA93467.1 mechanosensitive ion channel [Saprospiraceae bacterium]